MEFVTELSNAGSLAAKTEAVKLHAAKLTEARQTARQKCLENAALVGARDRLETEIKKLNEEIEAAKPPPPAPAPAEPEKKVDGPVQKFGAFIEQRGELFAIVTSIRDAFKYGSGIQESELRTASLDVVFTATEIWLQESSSLVARIDALAETGKSLEGEGADVHDVKDLRAAHDEAQSLYKQHSARWHRECTRRRSRAKLVSDFDADRTKLLLWCRQQVAMLANVVEPDHVQEFCASFYNNTAVMESNFLVLMEMSENLLPSAEIEGQLMELAEVWLGLETQAYEKLRSTLLDLHAKSGIEAQARLWPDFADKFQNFLVEAQRILAIPTDDESVAVAAPLKDACKELQANADPHRLIVAHLSDFALREECLKEHYNAIHKAAFSKLTLMTQSFPGLFTYQRKNEYTDRMAELSDWIDAKSRGQAWKDLLARVDRMKRLIEENELSLSNTEERY